MKNMGVKRILSRVLVVLMMLMQISFVFKMEVKAKTKAGVEVSVVSHDKVLLKDKSYEDNAYKALEEVLSKNNIPLQTKDESYGKYIEAIGEVKAGKFGGYDGWLYAVSRKGAYENISAAIDKFNLQDGDRLIVFYGGMETLTANKLEFSTNLPNSELQITLNNTYDDFQTKKEAVQPIQGIKAKVDGKEVEVKENIILIEKGLKDGVHTLELEDFNETKVPMVVNDVINFIIGDPNKAKEAEIQAIDIEKEINEASQYISQSEKYDLWAEISMMKLKIQPDDKFIATREEYILNNYEEISKGSIKDKSNIELEKLIMTLVNAGYTPYDFGKTDLVKELYSRNINEFLINDVIFGLITLNYSNIEEYKEVEESFINYLLDKKLSNKVDDKELMGWSYSGDKIDSDITAMVISALSKYYDNNEEVKKTIDKAVETLSYFQDEEGYMPNLYGISSEALSATINGLTSIGISSEEGIFLKERGNLVSALMSFKKDKGQFKHTIEDENANHMSSEQVVRALISLKGYKENGKYNFYSSHDLGELKKYNPSSENTVLANNKVIPIATIVVAIVIIGVIIKRRRAA